MRIAAIVLGLALTSVASAQPSTDAGAAERSIALTWVMNGAPSAEYGSDFVDASLVVASRAVVVRRPSQADLRCEEIARHDLTPDPGDEIVYGCGRICDDQFPEIAQDAGTPLGPYLVVGVVSASGPVIGIATTADMSCGSRITFPPAGQRRRMRLTGGGEDGQYIATYGLRGTRFVRVAMHYVESTY